MRTLLLIALTPTVSGCVVGAIASTAVDVATLPVKVVAAGVDAATTSRSEADEKRGRALRKTEEEAGKRGRAMEQRCRAGRPEPADTCPPRD